MVELFLKTLIEQAPFAVTLTIDPNMKPGYWAHLESGLLECSAPSPLEAAHALSTLTTAGEYIGEFLGHQRPHFPLRPLKASIPFEATISAGFNAVWIEEAAKISQARSWGLQTIFPLSQMTFPLPFSDFFLWESSPPPSTSQLILERQIAEMGSIESLLPPGSSLIFQVDRAEIDQLCDAAGPRTLIAFRGAERHLHPYWETMRKERVPSTTPLLPILNCPSPFFDEIQQRSYRHPFAGLFLMTNPPFSLTEWGQALWFNRSRSLF